MDGNSILESHISWILFIDILQIVFAADRWTYFPYQLNIYIFFEIGFYAMFLLCSHWPNHKITVFFFSKCSDVRLNIISNLDSVNEGKLYSIRIPLSHSPQLFLFFNILGDQVLLLDRDVARNFKGGRCWPWRFNETVNWRLPTISFLAFYFFLRTKFDNIESQWQNLSFKRGSRGSTSSPVATSLLLDKKVIYLACC